MEVVVQTFGMIFVGIIIVCIIWTFGTYITGTIDRPGKRNKKLTDNMGRIAKK